MDSGCSRDIEGKAIVSDLGLRMMELQKPLHIVSADSNTLDIIGTVTLFMSCQATGDKRRRIEATVLRGRKHGELLDKPQELEEDETSIETKQRNTRFTE